MLIREGVERDQAIDIRLACVLGCVAGAMNAAAFFAVGFFSANMTGNLSSLSEKIASGEYALASFFLSILMAFIFGSLCSSSLITAGRRKTRKIYAYALVLEASLIALVGGSDLWANRDWRVSIIVLGLAFAMGFQNAISTLISSARVRTTHVSGLITDIGIAASSFLMGKHELRGINASNLQLQLITVGSFLVGGVMGVLLYRVMGGYLQLITALALLTLSLLTITNPDTPAHDRAKG
ncbi:YoaK family protein [Aestuariivirga litoralis]|uniref:YoaK family protein n=1 Tax=Aestuariivirga litoralis TaxID=2650924 RepID=UPI0018C51466|nr:YoaK family protein [Aestuariivirga litoralis]MBG1232635.1 DUF1275 domain-containing protein [Aestuariivirga litoralis]